jgi:hypothetical protein
VDNTSITVTVAGMCATAGPIQLLPPSPPRPHIPNVQLEHTPTALVAFPHLRPPQPRPPPPPNRLLHPPLSRLQARQPIRLAWHRSRLPGLGTTHRSVDVGVDAEKAVFEGVWGVCQVEGALLSGVSEVASQALQVAPALLGETVLWRELGEVLAAVGG